MILRHIRLNLSVAAALVVSACGKNTTAPERQASTPSVTVPTPPTIPFANRRPQRIDTTWNDVRCIAPLNTPTMNFNEMACTLPSQGMKTWFGAMAQSLERLSDEYVLNRDTTEAIRAGFTSERFHIEPGWCGPGDCPGMRPDGTYERIEKSEQLWDPGNSEGDEVWYGWSLYIPDNTPIGAYTWLGQFQQYPSNKPVWMFGKNLFGLADYCAIYFPTVNNNYRCDGQSYGSGGNRIPEVPNKTLLCDRCIGDGKWHDFVLHAVWSADPRKGLTELWVDDGAGTNDPVLSFYGVTMLSGNQVYFKYGIYRLANSVTTTAYFDEVRKGKSRSQVAIQLLLQKP